MTFSGQKPSLLQGTQQPHFLPQVRVRVIDGQLHEDFARRYPGFPSNESTKAWRRDTTVRIALRRAWA